MMKSRLISALVGIALAVLVAMTPRDGFTSAYSDAWGPPVDSPLPVLQADDQAGVPRSIENLSGERGLLLMLSRSADW